MKVKHEVHAGDCLHGQIPHAGLKQVGRIQQARQVVEDELSVALGAAWPGPLG